MCVCVSNSLASIPMIFYCCRKKRCIPVGMRTFRTRGFENIFLLKLYLLPTASFFAHNGLSFYTGFFLLSHRVYYYLLFFRLSLHFNEYRLFYFFLFFFLFLLVYPCGALVLLCFPIVCHPFFAPVRITSTPVEHYVVLCLNRFEWILAHSINLTLPYKFTFEGGSSAFFAYNTS